MLQVSVVLNIAGVQEVRYAAATNSQYMKRKSQKRLKGMRREMMKTAKAV